MSKHSETDLEKIKDVRVAATSRIWGIAVGMLAICIPLSAVTRSGAILPLATIGGAAAGTFAVWRSDDKKSPAKLLQTQQLQQIEERLANLETIVSSDDFDLQMKMKRLEATNDHKV
ncbi:MAG: hypothetical protein VKL59_16850 [Nostocaceae cyanobacterium]|nr:hypothetical protein [Nostocaceae cyanobacterium]